MKNPSKKEQELLKLFGDLKKELDIKTETIVVYHHDVDEVIVDLKVKGNNILSVSDTGLDRGLVRISYSPDENFDRN